MWHSATPRHLALLACLTFLTLMAGNPRGPLHPLDARTWQPRTEFRLELSPAAALIEPLAAPGIIMAGAPDFRVAILSCLLWTVPLVFLWTLVSQSRRSVSSRLTPGALLRRCITHAILALVLVIGYLCLFLFTRLPGWQLVGTSDHLILDPQTHTTASKDGLIPLRDNLEWHAARGFDAVVITEHNHTRGSEAGQWLSRRDPELPVVLRGIELRESGGAWLLGVGERLSIDRSTIREEDLKDLTRFVDFVHQPRAEDGVGQPGGFVIAMSYRQQSSDLPRLLRAGVDGFELVNAGHPNLPETMRESLLDLSSATGLPLFASTDWHGWSGFCNTWTALHIRGARHRPRSEWSTLIMETLRQGDTSSIIPLSAGILGTPSRWRFFFSPFFESIRYMRNLGGLRLAAWWLWGGLFAIVQSRTKRSTRLGLTLFAFGAMLIYRGTALLLSCDTLFEGRQLVVETGSLAFLVGMAYLLCGMLRIAAGLDRRRLRLVEAALRLPDSGRMIALATADTTRTGTGRVVNATGNGMFRCGPGRMWPLQLLD